LLELYASGKLKPGLNIPVEEDKVFINDVVSYINIIYVFMNTCSIHDVFDIPNEVLLPILEVKLIFSMV